MKLVCIPFFLAAGVSPGAAVAWLGAGPPRGAAALPPLPPPPLPPPRPFFKSKVFFVFDAKSEAMWRKSREKDVDEFLVDEEDGSSMPPPPPPPLKWPFVILIHFFSNLKHDKWAYKEDLHVIHLMTSLHKNILCFIFHLSPPKKYNQP